MEYKTEWFSGTGKGGQHRNKHQNCCRLTCSVTGLKAVGQESRERSSNHKKALSRLNQKREAYFYVQKERRTTSEVIRNYHEVRNEVHDKASGKKMKFKDAIDDIGPLIEARKTAMIDNE